MNIRSLLNKNKYALSVFIFLAMLSLIYDGFESITALVCRLLLCTAVALFSAPLLTDPTKKETAVMPAFMLLSLISCNVIFLTDDLHILLSLTAFFAALFFNKKLHYLTSLFAVLCVVAQPLTILILVPSIVVVQLVRKQKVPALLSVVLSAAAFIVTMFLENSEFYADQFASYHLSLHLIHFSKTHTETLIRFLICSIALLTVVIAYIVKLLLKKMPIPGIAIIFTMLLAVYGYALSENSHTVFMLLVPVFTVLLSLNECDGFRETNEEISRFFIKHLFIFLLVIAFTAGFPMILGTLPFESEFFSRSTFVIFREE